MIKEFKNNEPRKSGIVYKSMFEQIKTMYATDPALAGELAISAIEMVLTDDYSSDNMMINLALIPAQVVNNGNVDKLNDKIERDRARQIESLKLEQISSLLGQGYTQGQIGKLIGVSQQTVSKRVQIIKKDYPELLVTSQPKKVVESCELQPKMVVESSKKVVQPMEEWYNHF